MSRARFFVNSMRLALVGAIVATACSDDSGQNDGGNEAGASGDGPTGGAKPSGGASGTAGSSGSNPTGGRGGAGDGGTTAGGTAGTSGTSGESGAGGDTGDGGAGAEAGDGGSAGTMAGMGGRGMGGMGGGAAGSGNVGGGVAGAGMAGAGMAGAGMAGAGNAGGGSGGAGGSTAGAGGSPGGVGGSPGGAGGSPGGSGGSGGTMGCATSNIIDDMEDGDGGICWSSTRQGGWYVGKQDGVGTIIPNVGTVVGPSLLSPARGTSRRGMHFQGAGFGGADHFAFIAAAINAGTNGVPYDASVHSGIRFWAKSDAGALAINVKFVTVATTDSIFGGSCIPTTVPCSDHWQAPRTLSGAWQQYSIYFPTDLSQLGWGVARPKDLAHLMGIEFYYGSNANPAAFDYWIDDVEFW